MGITIIGIEPLVCVWVEPEPCLPPRAQPSGLRQPRPKLQALFLKHIIWYGTNNYSSLVSIIPKKRPCLSILLLVHMTKQKILHDLFGLNAESFRMTLFCAFFKKKKNCRLLKGQQNVITDLYNLITLLYLNTFWHD